MKRLYNFGIMVIFREGEYHNSKLKIQAECKTVQIEPFEW